MKPAINYSDRDIETAMGNLLRLGVLLSACIVFAGGIVYMARHGQEEPAFRSFSGEPKQFTNLKMIFEYAFKGSGRAIIQVGVLVLIATPIARIIFSIIGFIKEKDILYTGITLFVLGVIIASLL
jgi:uncharacterized membrane protein